MTASPSSPPPEDLLTRALPKSWPTLTKAGVVHAMALARVLFTFVVGKPAEESGPFVALGTGSPDGYSGADQARLEVQIALLREELALVHARLGRLPSRKRPNYTRPERLRALALMAARGYNRVQAGKALLVEPATLSRWLRWADDDSPNLEHSPPVNAYPDEVTTVLHQLKALFPHFGKRRLAQMLARLGLHLAETTIARKLQEPPPQPAPPEAPDTQPEEALGTSDAAGATNSTGADAAKNAKTGKTVVARFAGHVWGCDISVVPTFLGFWVPWVPFSIDPSWPFCFHVFGVKDFFSRNVIGLFAFKKNPSAADIALALDHAVARAGGPPKHIVSDKGSQFWSVETEGATAEYRDWCDRHGVRPRFGAVGKTGSIAVVERFWRSLKSELTRRVTIPFCADRMHVLLESYRVWFNRCRPHQGVGGATPLEMFGGKTPARDEARVEIRECYPLQDARARARGSPEATRATLRGVRVSYLDGHHELPMVELVFDQAA